MTDFRFDDPDRYVQGTPYEEYAKLRATVPFSWARASQDDGTEGFWLATKHRDVVSISKNPRLFSTSAPLLADPLPQDLWPEFPALKMIADNLMTYDPQRHARFRPMANALFSTARLLAAEARIRAKCREVLQRVHSRPAFDFANDVALPLATEVILGDFVGLPQADLSALGRCILTINAMDDPFFRPREQSLYDAAKQLFAYGLDIVYRRITPSPDTVLSELLGSGALHDVTPEEFFLIYWFPLAAGAFDTTASTIAGGVRALQMYPQQLERLRKDNGLIASAVDEMLRWVSPVVYFRRTATADTHFGGHSIRQGDRVILCYASANRDPEVFAAADEFDVGRTPNDHVSFGYGPHFCLGARLATMVLRLFLEEFVLWAPRLRAQEPVTHTRSAWMNRIRCMPVEYARDSI